MIVRLSKREAVILDLPPLGEINFSPPTGLWATMAQNWIPPVRAWDGENLQGLQLAASRLPYLIFLHYLTAFFPLKQLPYRFPDTHTVILGNRKLPDSEFVLDSLEAVVLGDALTRHRSLSHPEDEHGWHPIDEIFRVAGPIWRPAASSLRPAPTGMIDYIIWRQRDNEILDRTLAAWDPLLLLKGLAIRLKRRYLAGPLDALWILCSSDGLIGWRNLLQPQVYEGVISAINKRGPATVRSATEPLLALVKYRWLNCTVSQSEAIAMLKYSIMPTETAVELPAVILSALLQDKIHDPGIFWDIFRIRRAEAALCILTNLLDICCVATPPARAAEAVKYLEIDPLLGDPIHEAHQLHLANSIQKIAQMAQEAATGYEHQNCCMLLSNYISGTPKLAFNGSTIQSCAKH
ncbi:hypothetical protein C8J57DRAFT_1304478 [Mycena rebaudengoi]|nr:hypothetical protein C8J57DRAFT_1304478 [Mycena rebaudengoi]